jgi:hypothetical protein
MGGAGERHHYLKKEIRLRKEISGSGKKLGLRNAMYN